jgi:hypothetical protein
MRISKKFVGSNCIGKQVFRRRTADINRLTPEQIQQSRAELSELERRFLERVAQTNRVKSSGVGGGGGNAAEKAKEEMDNNPPSPPWLNPPFGYKHGQGAALAAANLSGGGSNRSAAAAGRALLQGLGSGDFNGMFDQKQSNPSLSSRGSAGLLALAGLGGGGSNSHQNLLNALSGRGSSSNFRSRRIGEQSLCCCCQFQQQQRPFRICDGSDRTQCFSCAIGWPYSSWFIHE